MGRTILCENCKSTINEDILAKKENPNICPVCGESLVNDVDMPSATKKEKHTYYYYEGAGGTLTTTLYDDETPIYTFEAVDMKDAERQLKKVMPNSPLLRENTEPETRCPYCRSKEIQLVPKKFSLLTGFATNRYDRICVHCKRKF